jgi:phage shock protein B
MDGEIIMVPIVVGILFLGLPWLILNHITKWKTAATLTNDDERMLGEMYDLARRLEDRMDTVERLVAQDNPDFAPRRIDHESEDYISENIRRLERNR